jgi:hypothetical protein
LLAQKGYSASMVAAQVRHYTTSLVKSYGNKEIKKRRAKEASVATPGLDGGAANVELTGDVVRGNVRFGADSGAHADEVPDADALAFIAPDENADDEEEQEEKRDERRKKRRKRRRKRRKKRRKRKRRKKRRRGRRMAP